MQELLVCRDAEIDMTCQLSKHSITWVSEQLMKGRANSSNFNNYGERLYVEGLVELEKKKALVCHNFGYVCL